VSLVLPLRGRNTQKNKTVSGTTLYASGIGHEGLSQRVLQLLFAKEFRKVRHEFSNGLIASMPGSICFFKIHSHSHVLKMKYL